MTLAEFEQVFYNVVMASPICDVPFVRRLTPTFINLRVTVTVGGFVEAFYNEVTGTMAFVLIQDSSRVFGTDNTGGWHLHPFSDPTEHIPLSEAMSFADFIAAVEQHFATSL